MAVFFAVFGRQAIGGQLAEEAYESAKLLGAKSTAPKSGGGLESARVVRLEAGSIAEAQKAVRFWFGGDVSDTPVVITEAAFKES